MMENALAVAVARSSLAEGHSSWFSNEFRRVWLMSEASRDESFAMLQS